jgi:serine/threonine protein kinase
VRLETLRSASPEAIKGMALTGASSVFAAASVLAELLTTTAPFLRATMMETLIAVVEGAPTWAAEANPGVPRALREVLRRALQPRPGDRWSTLAELQRAVLGAVDLEPATTERAATVCLSVAFPLVQLQLRALERAPDWLPEVWRGGGLEVLEDELLESLVPLDRFPARRGSRGD